MVGGPKSAYMRGTGAAFLFAYSPSQAFGKALREEGFFPGKG